MEQPDIFTRATFWAMANPASLPRSGMIELVTAAGFGASSPIMQEVLAHPDGLLTTPSEVVKALLCQAEQRAGRQRLFAKRDPLERLVMPPRIVHSARKVKQAVP
ncbi:hypothetical protein [Acidisphaera sp. L21]|uniref:hypothetical protein n=1 Tax=Acidisphaera sp. L21 TaxID=1641851 RepID=UPI00131E84D6|nr:hypothetical protein [Acidisphaera sp. L21]